MAARLRLRDAISRLPVPWWLSDRRFSGKTVGYRLLWGLISVLDVLLEGLLQGMRAAWPGAGSPAALPYIGRSRGVIRGVADTHAEYAAKLRRWRDRWAIAGSMEWLAREFQDFLGDHPRIRIVSRSGKWLTLEEDGTITRDGAAWDWDSVSNPERNQPDAPCWSDVWVIVYTSEWIPRQGALGDVTNDGFCLGHLATPAWAAELKGVISEGAPHTCVRAVIWTTDEDLFDPDEPSSLPDGTWGTWSLNVGGSRVKSGRDLTSCRYWEPF